MYLKAKKWVESLSQLVLSEVERSIGKIPSIEKNWLILTDGPTWIWWLMVVLPVTSRLRVSEQFIIVGFSEYFYLVQ